MLSAATAALLARDFKSSVRQTIMSDFKDAFVKTGLIDEKFYKYFCQAFGSRKASDDSSMASPAYRAAQTYLIRTREFVAACRTLCD